MDIQMMDLPHWSKYVLETPNGIFQPHQTLLENIFKIVAYNNWDWNDKDMTPDPFFFHGYINKPNYSKYYSLGASLAMEGPLLDSFINKIRIATEGIGLNKKATPMPDVKFDEIDIKEQSIERHFSETLFWANQHLMIRPRPIRYMADQLSTYMSNEIGLFVGLDGMHHINSTSAILDTDRTNFTTEVLNKKLKVNSMKYNPMINPKDEVDIKKVNQFFEEHVSKEMLGSILEEMEFGPLTIHQLLFTLNINQVSVNNGVCAHVMP